LKNRNKEKRKEKEGKREDIGVDQNDGDEDLVAAYHWGDGEGDAAAQQVVAPPARACWCAQP